MDNSPAQLKERAPCALPLEGIRVLDFSSYIAGPYCPALLADLGAEVIKIEAHRGDQTRYFPSTLKGETRMFLGVNRNKQGMVLDLKQEAAREIIYKLTKSADVVVENFRPGVSDRLTHRLRTPVGHQSTPDLLLDLGIRRARPDADVAQGLIRCCKR